MPIGMLASGAVGEVVSPADVLVMLPSGQLQNVAWGTAGALVLNANGSVSQGATAAPVSFVASTTASGASATAWSIAVPAGAQVGDVLLITGTVDEGPSFGAMTGFTEAANLKTTFDGQNSVVWWRMLDGTEGATINGTLTGSSEVCDWAAIAALFRGADEVTPVGTATTVTDNTGTASQAITCASVPVNAGGAAFFSPSGDPHQFNAATTFSTPTGFTLIGNADGPDLASPVAAFFDTYAAAGNTGAVTSTGTFSGTALSAWMGALVPINASLPFGLSGTLPTSATVGVLYQGTLQVTGNYTAPVTIGGLPSWLSGSASGRTVTISGTPTATATVTFTPTITDSASHSGTGTSQSITVSAAGTSFAVLSTTRKNSAITLSNGNLSASTIDSGAAGTIDVASCIAAATANVYWECTATTIQSGSNTTIGLMSTTNTNYGSVIGITGDANSMSLDSNGTFYRTWSGTSTAYTYAQGATLMFWLHNGSLFIGNTATGWFGGSSGGVPTTALATGITGSVGPAYSSDGSYGSTRAWTFNFGASPWAGTIPAGATGWTT